MGLPWACAPSFPCFFLASPRSPIPDQYPYHHIPVGKDEGTAFRYNQVGLKGHLFRLFAEQMVVPERLRDFLSAPTSHAYLDAIQPGPRSQSAQEQVVQLSLFTSVSAPGKRAKNYGKPMRFFVPDWDDLVDPGYNFERDLPAEHRKRYESEVYAHQIYQETNVDGLLFSRCTVENGKAKTERVRSLGIHAFARFGKPIMGDCGAFSYITEDIPPYQTPELLDYYQALGFDYGVSLDHLIVPAFYPVKEYRYQITRENAREFLRLHRARNYTFTPIGVAQGWSPETYRDAVIELLEWGYTYIALGGIARTQTRDIYDILESVAPVLQAETDLHLLGVARDREGDEMQRFRELGVTSFDSASYLRRAWLSDTANYLTPDGGRYTALRISPISASRPRVKQMIAEGRATYAQLQKLERDALHALREYDRGALDIDTTLNFLLEIEKVEGSDVQREDLYRRTLEDRPWKRCSCEICRDLGIDVLLFRGNDRNRRRGFHNTLTFYRRFQQLMEQASQPSRKGAYA
jgi:queuine/archaeosine tRNA-ribosyltransferase